MANTRTLSRDVLRVIRPDLLAIFEKVPDLIGLIILIRDIKGEGSIYFKGVSPSPELVATGNPEENEKNVIDFLKGQQFSERNINLILKNYSQRPSYSLQFGSTLLSLEFNNEIISADEYKNEIYEDNDQVFFRAQGSTYIVKDASSKIIATINDELNCLFQLTDAGFKLVEITVTGKFSDLLYKYLTGWDRSEQIEIDKAIWLYCTAGMQEKYLNQVVRRGLFNINLHHTTFYNLLYGDNVSYLQNNHSENYSKLIIEITSYYQTVYETLLLIPKEAIEDYRKMKDKFDDNICNIHTTLKIQPEELLFSFENGETFNINQLESEEKIKYPSDMLQKLEQISLYSSGSLLLKKKKDPEEDDLLFYRNRVVALQTFLKMAQKQSVRKKLYKACDDYRADVKNRLKAPHENNEKLFESINVFKEGLSLLLDCLDQKNGEFTIETFKQIFDLNKIKIGEYNDISIDLLLSSVSSILESAKEDIFEQQLDRFSLRLDGPNREVISEQFGIFARTPKITQDPTNENLDRSTPYNF